jgi:hypothetical protein
MLKRIPREVEFVFVGVWNVFAEFYPNLKKLVAEVGHEFEQKSPNQIIRDGPVTQILKYINQLISFIN